MSYHMFVLNYVSFLFVLFLMDVILKNDNLLMFHYISKLLFSWSLFIVGDDKQLYCMCTNILYYKIKPPKYISKY
jgi:hypothetical protein